MNIKPILITVTDGRRKNILRHQFLHYKDFIKDAYIIIYEHEHTNKLIKNEIEEIINSYGQNIHILTHKARFSDIQEVTNIYNQIKNLYPNDWWIIADDDEFHLYREPISNLIKDCESNRWEYICGGFIDRIGVDGTFPEIKKEIDLWKTFPIASFFRYPLSGGCPNKICLAKGRIKLGVGQHFIQENNNVIFGKENIFHTKRYKIDKNFIQVHHFKWDETVLERLIASIKLNEDYACSKEFKRMYDSIKNNNFKININNKNFLSMYLDAKDYNSYIHWDKIKDIILYRENQW